MRGYTYPRVNPQAAKSGDLDGCTHLLMAGEDPNEVDSSLSTPLIHTVCQGIQDEG